MQRNFKVEVYFDRNDCSKKSDIKWIPTSFPRHDTATFYEILFLERVELEDQPRQVTIRSQPEPGKMELMKDHLLLIQCYYRRKPKLN